MTETDVAPVRLAAGDTAPEFTLSDADGRQVSLTDYRAGGSSCIATRLR